jgi:hypothetical protein
MIRGMVPGASLRLVTSPSRVNDRIAIHGPCDIDTEGLQSLPVEGGQRRASGLASPDDGTPGH